MNLVAAKDNLKLEGKLTKDKDLQTNEDTKM